MTILLEIGPIRVFEDRTSGALVVNKYLVVLTRAPETVTITAVPVALRESVSLAGGKGVKVMQRRPAPTARR